jgi:hypothetical protein
MKKLILFAMLLFIPALAQAETADSTVIKLDQKIENLKQQQEQLKANFARIEGAIMALETVKKEAVEANTKKKK